MECDDFGDASVVAVLLTPRRHSVLAREEGGMLLLSVFASDVLKSPTDETHSVEVARYCRQGCAERPPSVQYYCAIKLPPFSLGAIDSVPCRMCGQGG